jgi:toxin ParE1/3/4
MNRHIIPSPDARADLESIARWYRRIDSNLSRQFRAEARKTLFRIAQFPYASLRVNDVVRRVLMARFPYRIDFTFNADILLVISITHQRRAETVWKDRINRFAGGRE